VFDQGLGDLWVIRVDGNIVAPSQVGSVEFAAARYDTRLVVVLGHSQCGAILATLDELRKPTEKPALAEAVQLYGTGRVKWRSALIYGLAAGGGN
jgi:carbonic anhydrase